MIYFTSDTHFHHAKVIDYCNRPFANVDEMNEALIKNWNDRVKRWDIVYHLGDFCFGNKQKIKEVLDRLNGNIFLIEGNHDRNLSTEIKQRFGWIKPYYELKHEGQHLVLCHYPFASWNGSHHGWIHLHGHSHGSTKNHGNFKRLDVGVDCHNFYPFELSDVIKMLENESDE